MTHLQNMRKKLLIENRKADPEQLHHACMGFLIGFWALILLGFFFILLRAAS